jgi:hypothetical protein
MCRKAPSRQGECHPRLSFHLPRPRPAPLSAFHLTHQKNSQPLIRYSPINCLAFHLLRQIQFPWRTSSQNHPVSCARRVDGPDLPPDTEMIHVVRHHDMPHVPRTCWQLMSIGCLSSWWAPEWSMARAGGAAWAWTWTTTELHQTSCSTTGPRQASCIVYHISESWYITYVISHMRNITWYIPWFIGISFTMIYWYITWYIS